MGAGAFKMTSPPMATSRAGPCAPPASPGSSRWPSKSKNGVRLAQKTQVGPYIPVGIQLEEAAVGATSGITKRLSHLDRRAHIARVGAREQRRRRHHLRCARDPGRPGVLYGPNKHSNLESPARPAGISACMHACRSQCLRLSRKISYQNI